MNRSRPIEEDLGPPYYATYEVDAVEFSQDSSSVAPVLCGSHRPTTGPQQAQKT